MSRRLEHAIALLAALSWLAAMIHVAAVPEHWEEYRPFAACFALLALVQAGWAAWFFRAPTRALLRFAAALSLGVLCVWVASRTTGLPLGPDAGRPEPVGAADASASAAELALALAAIGLARRWPAPRVPRWSVRVGTAVLCAGALGLVLGGHAH